MSNQLANYHVLDGQPAGEGVTISEIADHYGNLLFEIRPIKKQDECWIFGSEITFEKKVPVDKINEVCADIWNNPKQYCDYDGESAYYNFLKYLWVEFPDGSEKRLVDVLEEIE